MVDAGFVQKGLSTTALKGMERKCQLLTTDCPKKTPFEEKFGGDLVKRDYEKYGQYKQFLEPKEIMGLAEQVKDLYLDKQMNDEQIAKELRLHPRAAYQLRKLLGLARKYGDIRRDNWQVLWDEIHGVFKMGSFPLVDVQDELGMDAGKAYGWRAIEMKTVKKNGNKIGLLTLEFKEMKAKDINVQKKKKEKTEKLEKAEDEDIIR